MSSPRALPLAVATLAMSLAAACNCGGIDPPPDSGVPDAGDGIGLTCDAPFAGAGTPLANGLDGPRRLLKDDTDLYVTEAGALAPGFGRLTRISLQGGGSGVVAAEFEYPDAMAVDSDYVFLTDERGVWRVNKTSGQPTLISPLLVQAQLGITDLETAGAQLVVATGQRYLIRLEKDGTGLLELFAGSAGTSVRSVEIEGPYAYFLVGGSPTVVSEHGLYRVPVDGSAAAERLAAPTDARALELTPQLFLWAEGRAAPDGRVRVLERADGGIRDVATGLRAPSSPVVVGRYVYFHDETDPSHSATATDLFLRRTAPCSAGTASAVVGPLGYGPGELLLDDRTLYFTSVGLAGAGYVGRIP